MYNHDINAGVTNLSKLEEAIKGKDDQIHKLNMLLGKSNIKAKSNFKSHSAYDTARRFPSIGDELGLTRGNKVNITYLTRKPKAQSLHQRLMKVFYLVMVLTSTPIVFSTKSPVLLRPR